MSAGRQRITGVRSVGVCRYAATRACKAAWRPKLLEDLHVGAQWWIGVAFMDAGLLGREGAGLQGCLGAGRCRDPGQRCRIAGVRGVRVESVR